MIKNILSDDKVFLQIPIWKSSLFAACQSRLSDLSIEPNTSSTSSFAIVSSVGFKLLRNDRISLIFVVKLLILNSPSLSRKLRYAMIATLIFASLNLFFMFSTRLSRFWLITSTFLKFLEDHSSKKAMSTLLCWFSIRSISAIKRKSLHLFDWILLNS